MSLNTFINLEGNISGYSQNDKPLTGHVTIGMPGRVKLYLDNLKDSDTKNYVCYLMSKTKNKAVRLGEITPPSQNKQSTFKIDLKDIGGKGLLRQDIDGIAIVLEGASVGNTDVILTGYDGATYTPSSLLQSALPKVTPAGYRKQSQDIKPDKNPIDKLSQKMEEDKNIVKTDVKKAMENIEDVLSSNDIVKKAETVLQKGFIPNNDIHAAIKEVDTALGINTIEKNTIEKNTLSELQPVIKEIDKALDTKNVAEENHNIMGNNLQNKQEESIQILDMRKMIEEIVEKTIHKLLDTEQEHPLSKKILALVEKTLQETTLSKPDQEMQPEKLSPAIDTNTVSAIPEEPVSIAPNLDKQIFDKIKEVSAQIENMENANKSGHTTFTFDELSHQIKTIKDMLASKPVVLPVFHGESALVPNSKLDAQPMFTVNKTSLPQQVPIVSPKPIINSNEQLQPNTNSQVVITPTTLQPVVQPANESTPKLSNDKIEHIDHLDGIFEFIDSIKTLISHQPTNLETNPSTEGKPTALEAKKTINLENILTVMNTLIENQDKSQKITKPVELKDITELNNTLKNLMEHNTSIKTPPVSTSQERDCGCNQGIIDHGFNNTIDILAKILSNKKTQVTEEEIKKLKATQLNITPEMSKIEETLPKETSSYKNKSEILSEFFHDTLDFNIDKNQKTAIENLIKSGFQTEKHDSENNLEDFIKRIEVFKKTLNESALKSQPEEKPVVQEKIIGKYDTNPIVIKEAIEQKKEIIKSLEPEELEEIIEIPSSDLLSKQEEAVELIKIEDLADNQLENIDDNVEVGDINNNIDAPIDFGDELDDLEDNIEINLDKDITELDKHVNTDITELEEKINTDVTEFEEKINTDVTELEEKENNDKSVDEENLLKKICDELDEDVVECEEQKDDANTNIEAIFRDMIDDGEPIEFEEDFDRLKELIKNNIHTKPFDNKLPITWVYISLADLKSIPQVNDEWASQPKLIEAYEKYEHLILGKENDMDKFYIGIPDRSTRSKNVNIDIKNVVEFVLYSKKPHKFNGYWIANI